MRISDWSSDVCSSDLLAVGDAVERHAAGETEVRDAVLRRQAAGQAQHDLLGHRLHRGGDVHVERDEQVAVGAARRLAEQVLESPVGHGEAGAIVEVALVAPEAAVRLQVDQNSEERRVGNGMGSTWRSRWWSYHVKTKNI